MVFCYSVRIGYELSFEIAAHIAVHNRLSKGIKLFVCLSYSVVKELASAKGRLDCQTLPAVSSEISPDPRRNCVQLGWLFRVERTSLPRNGYNFGESVLISNLTSENLT